MIVYDCAVPVQVLLPDTKVGVIFTVATKGLVPVLLAVKDGIVAVLPALVKPILGKELVQE